MRCLPITTLLLLLLTILAACGGDNDDQSSGPQGSARGPSAVTADSGLLLQGFVGFGADDGENAKIAIAEGITVTGYGDASDAPTGATVRLTISSGDAFFGSGTSIEISLIDPEEMEPVVDAIAAKGVNEDDISVNTFAASQFSGYGASAQIVFQWGSVDDINTLAEDLTDIVRRETDYSLAGFEILFTVDDCPQLEEQAQEAALEDARNRAEKLADLSGLELGNIVAIAEGGGSVAALYGVQTGCAGLEELNAFDLYGSNPNNSAEEIEIDSTLTVTFAVN